MTRTGMWLECDSTKFKIISNGKEITPKELGWCRLTICPGSMYNIDCTIKDEQIKIKVCNKGMDEVLKLLNGNKE